MHPVDFPYIDDFCDDEVYVFSTMGQGPAGEVGNTGPQGPKGDKGDAGIIPFDTVADMRASTDLKAGMTVHTNGFYEVGDSGAAYYTISNDGVDNDMDVFKLENNLYALLVITKPYIIPEQLGAYGDGTHDDAACIQYAINAYKNVMLSQKTYAVSTTIYIDKNNISLVGATNACIIPSIPHGDSVKGSILKYIGSPSSSSSVLLVNQERSYTPNVNFPSQGIVLKNIGIDGNNKAGIGIYITFAAYNGEYDMLYAQRCTTTGIIIAQSWSVNFGLLYAWFNAIGIIIGHDFSNINRSINQCTFKMLNGHSSFDYVPDSNLHDYAGTGVVLHNTSAVSVESVDVEQNEFCGIDVKSKYGTVINAIWSEFNALDTGGIGMKCSGYLDIGTYVAGVVNETIQNKGRLDIGIFESTEAYYPFVGSNVLSVRVGKCSAATYSGLDLRDWTALIPDFMVWARIDGLASNVVSTAHPIIMPTSDVASSIVIMPKNSVSGAGSFVILSSGNTLSIPAKDWTNGTPYILNNYNSAGDYRLTRNFGVYTANSSDMKFDVEICSIKYFYNDQWRQLKQS